MTTNNRQTTLKTKVEELEKTEILNALRRCGWVKATAAQALGITQRMIAYKIKKYGLQKEVLQQSSKEKADQYNSAGSAQ